MKILITGASGLIGRKCVEILSKKYSIIAVDKKFINKQKNNNIKYINIDVTNKKSFFKKIKIKKNRYCNSFSCFIRCTKYRV